MIAAVVVDTDVVSFLFKGHPFGELYREHLAAELLAISFMTLAELDLWVLERNWGPQRCAKLDEYLKRFVVLPYHRGLCRTWALATQSARRNGRPLQCGDGWIAAAALFYRIPLITHNRRHYAGVDGLTVISEAPL